MTMKDETKNWVAISKYTGNVNAEMARDFLNDNDIPAFIKSDFFGSAYHLNAFNMPCLLYTSPSPRDKRQSRMPSSA